MKKLILMAIIFTFMLIPLLAQSSPVMDSLNILLNQTKNEQEQVDILNKLAFLQKNKNRDKALLFANKALEKAKSIKYYQGQVSSLICIGTIKSKTNEVEEVIKSFEYIDTIYNSHIDSLKYQIYQKEQQKEITQLQLQTSEIKRKYQMYLGVTLLLFVALLAGIAAFVAYRNRQKQFIAEYKAEKAYAEIDDLLVEQELKMANAKLEAKDETEKRIAQDLHDRLGTMLSTIKLYFNDINEELNNAKIEISQQKANELLDEASTEIRLVAHNMASGTLSKFGLIDGLKELVNTINGSNQIEAILYTHGLKERLNSKTEVTIYKIILELVGNALKHAQAQKLNIQLNQIGEELHIMVEDNGIGFLPEEAEKKQGMGLRNITLRVADLNGRFHIDSGKGNGTTIDISIPLKIIE